MRMMIIGSAFMALASAFLLYGLNYDTRVIAKLVNERERTIVTIKNDIAVLKAERAHLARPERIAPHARKLGLGPIDESQIVAREKRSADASSLVGEVNPAAN